MTQPTVSVVVLNYNGASHLPECLASLKEQTYPNVGIIVADNGSTDDSKEVCSTFPQVMFVENGDNFGFSVGNNLGARQARGEYLFFVNNDMRFAPDMITNLVGVFEEAGDLFALDAKQYNWEGDRVVHSAVRFRQGPYGAVFLPFIDTVQLDVPEVTPTPWACGANLFCSRDLFRSLGGFDPSFFMQWEDVDLCWRARLRGWKTLYVPNAVCWHKVSAGGSDELPGREGLTPTQKRRFWSGHHNRFRFAMKTMDLGPNMSLLLWCIRSILGYLKQGMPLRARLLAQAYLDCIREWREIRKQRALALSGCHVSSREIIKMFWLDSSR